MQTISLKIADSILIRIDECIAKHNYSTKSEFIRDAIRDKLEQLENQKFESEIRDYLNKSSKNREVPISGQNTANAAAELDKAKNDIFLELERKFDGLRAHLREK